MYYVIRGQSLNRPIHLGKCACSRLNIVKLTILAKNKKMTLLQGAAIFAYGFVEIDNPV